MSFRFNFENEEEVIVSENEINTTNSNLSEFKSHFVDLTEKHFKKQHSEFEITQTNLEDGWSFKHISSHAVENTLKITDSSILAAIKKHSDLLPGIYEGGLKIWECSLDLLDYIIKNKVSFKDQHVLELGCGAGLPGILAFMQGAIVTFQDYNEEVLDLVTIPNLILNCDTSRFKDETNIKLKCKFVSGDWSGLSTCLEKLGNNFTKYDIILTSETIYNLESQVHLLQAMKNLLKENGVIYLAAKTHYFGVGGGTRQFEEFVRKDGTFEITVCKTYEIGLQREILKLVFQKP